MGNIEAIMLATGSLIIDLKSTLPTPEEIEILRHPLIGGVILFSRNYADRTQLSALCKAIKTARSEPLLIMVDQEGGRVQRFTKDFTKLPPLGKLGELYETEPQQACQLAKEIGWLMATELLAIGIDLSLAPVLDLRKHSNHVIGDRAFHLLPRTVIPLAKAYVAGMNEAGMTAVGKHFPGHGTVLLDSHHVCPEDHREYSEIELEDMLPFKELIKSGMNAIMASHVLFKQVDEYPVGYSKVWLKNILRDTLQFKGVILSDDLNMAGAAIPEQVKSELKTPNYADRVALAREAGCDFILLCNNQEAVISVLNNLPTQSDRVFNEKINILKNRFRHSTVSFNQQARWISIHQQLSEI